MLGETRHVAPSSARGHRDSHTSQKRFNFMVAPWCLISPKKNSQGVENETNEQQTTSQTNKPTNNKQTNKQTNKPTAVENFQWSQRCILRHFS